MGGVSDLKPEAVVMMTDDLLVAITARAEGRGVDRSTRLTLREEVIDPQTATALGGRSIQLDLDLDCTGRRVIVGARRIYDRPNLQGSVRITRTDGGWVQAPADTVVDEVIRAACSPQPPAPLLAAQPEPPPAPAPTQAVALLSTSPPAAAAGRPAARTASSPDAPRPTEFALQIAAATSADLARDAWQALKTELPDLVGPRAFAVEPVSAKGRTLYRALLLGFASQDEASALCKTLRSRSVDCIPRQMR